MTIAADASVTFDNCGFLSVDSGTCVIQVRDANTERNQLQVHPDVK